MREFVRRFCALGTKKVRGFALKELDIARRFIRQLLLGFLFPWMRRRPPEQRQITVPQIAKRLNINTYICSGFVQWAYYKAVSQIREEDKSDKPDFQEIFFNPRFDGKVTEDDLLSTTPADIARSEKLNWKYLIKDGIVFEVSSEEEVNKVLQTI